MSGRGIERDPRGRRRWAGRGSPPPAREAREAHKTEAKFKGANHELPSLNYGASPKENRPIEFLQLMGEYSARTYKDGIAQAFWTSPPQFGEEEEEPVMPEAIPNTNAGKVIMADFTNDKKEWKLDKKKVTADKKTAFAVTYGQLAEASRSEVQDHEDWAEAFINRDLLFLIERIRSTHIARQSGNPRQDMERVRNLWSSRSMHMQPHESSFAFRKRVEDYQLERVAVGLPEILDEELVIGILNRLDMSRYHSLVKDYLDNERRGIAELPELSSTLWKEIKDTQIIRFRGMAPTNLHGVYVSHADETPEAGRGHGRGRGRYQGRGGRGRGSTGRGRGRGPPDSPAITESIKPSDIICWSCGKKGHRSSACPSRAVHFADSTRDAIVFLTTIADFTSTAEDRYPEQVKTDAIIPVFLSTSTVKNKKLYLDTQSGIHLISNSELLVDISDSVHPITVQGITGDRTRVTAEGTIKSLGTIAYYNPNVAANILSYHKLQETHHVTYDETNDTFIAAPFLVGPILEFPSTDGHYVLDFDTVLQVYITATDQKAAKYTKRQLTTARLAYDFIIRTGFISYKAAAEVVQRGSISDLGFTRADLVNAQDIHGTPAAYQLGQGISTPNKHYTDDPIPMHESVAQELQVDIFFFLGQAFFVSISVLLGLIMVTHLGPASDSIKDSKVATQTIGARAKAGQALLMHIKQYMSKGFVINRVTSDGEASIKATKHDIEAFGVELNILGHGSHTPHAEAAIRHIKNKARSTLYSLGYKLPNRLASALIAFVVHTSNMVPKINSVGHQPAHSAFLGRVPNFKRDAPHPFGIAGFLQRTHSPGYNSAAPRGDYCIWLGTTHNLAGTHRCLNLTTLREMTGDTFHPTLLTPEAIRRLNTLAGVVGDSVDQPETPLENPSAPYPLDPYRGVIPDEETLSTEQQGDIIGADTIADTDIQVMDPSEAEEELRTKSLADIVIETRDTTSPDNEVQDLDSYKQVLATLSIKSARKIYGKEISDKATTEELQTCIQKDVWEYLDPMYVTKNAIPSRMFLTPKSLPNGTLDRIKGRIVAGGHKQDRSLYEDSEVSSPTVALTSVIAMAALAAREGHHVMSLDHKAAYLNADMTGTPVEMLLSPEVAEILCGIDIKYEKYVRKDRKIAVRLKKALYGCVQSAVLWYNELTSTLESIGFSRNPYDTCSFTRARDNTFDRILVYVDDERYRINKECRI